MVEARAGGWAILARMEVRAGDVTLWARVEGKGPSTLLILHGGPGISSEPLFAFEALASDSLRVVWFDQRATGRSGLPDRSHDPKSYDAEHFAGDVAAVLQAVGASRAHLFGHSWGGLVAQEVAALRPQLVQSLTLCCSIPPTRAAFDAGLQAMNAWHRTLQERGVIPDPIPDAFGPERLRAIWPRFFAAPHDVMPFSDTLTINPRMDLLTFATRKSWDHREALRRLDAPSFVSMGALDRFGRGWFDEAVSALPGARTQWLEQAGHFPWHEQPAAVFGALREFLASC